MAFAYGKQQGSALAQALEWLGFLYNSSTIRFGKQIDIPFQSNLLLLDTALWSEATDCPFLAISMFLEQQIKPVIIEFQLVLKRLYLSYSHHYIKTKEEL